MDIKGLDYNTMRTPLVMPEYGRGIQKMVDHLVEIPSRPARTRLAKAVVRLMETKVPHLRSNVGYKQTLWDHLCLMGRGRLDIDWPFDVSGANRMSVKPKPLPLPSADIHLRHYGRLVEQLIAKEKTLPNGPEHDALVTIIANQMRRDLIQWGHGSSSGERVADDLAALTNGRVQLDLKHFFFEKYVPVEEPKAKKRKRK